MFKAAKPCFKHVMWNTNTCLNVKTDRGETLSNAWHYHPEIELILVKNSCGTRIIGTSIENFTQNDLILIGKNLPHAFLHEEKFLQQKATPAESIVVQFHENFLGIETLLRSEFSEVQKLFSVAGRGLSIEGSAKARIIPLVSKMPEVSSFERIIIILEIFKVLSEKNAYRILVQNDPVSITHADDGRIGRILEYTYAHYDGHIRIDDVAKIANLTKESFCRYFKTNTRKTYMEFLTEYRISKACNMIKNEEGSMKEIGYSCGFDSLSNFYYQFRRIVKLSPLAFKKNTAGESLGIQECQ